MKWLVTIRPEAENDLIAARDWYDERRSGLGDEFLDEISLAMLQLESSPERERLYYRNFRRIIVRRFPYKVFYQIIDNRVVVFRVLHAKQEHGGNLSQPKP